MSVGSFLSYAGKLVTGGLYSTGHVKTTNSDTNTLIILSTTLHHPSCFGVIRLSRPFLAPRLVLAGPSGPLAVDS